MTLWSHKRFHPQIRSEGSCCRGPPCKRARVCVCVTCGSVPSSAPNTLITMGVLCVLVNVAAPSNPWQALMNALIMLKMLHAWASLCLQERLARDGYTAQREPVGTQRLQRSTLMVLDVSGPKIDVATQSKYHGNIKVVRWTPQNKQLLQVEPQQLPHCKSHTSPHGSNV